MAPVAPAIQSVLPAHQAVFSEHDFNHSRFKNKTHPHHTVPSRQQLTPHGHNTHTTHTTASTPQAKTFSEYLNVNYQHVTPAQRSGALLFLLLVLSMLAAYCTHACMKRRTARETSERAQREAIQGQIDEQRARVGRNADDEVGTQTVTEQESLEVKVAALRS
ncbi:hypothetical protein BC830DRAFT_412923 [Chytriomyces sp. MP71]|nr:hypothetical protein BC830DRAFT_412923 [Chytriomyces sp. MP71]